MRLSLAYSTSPEALDADEAAQHLNSACAFYSRPSSLSRHVQCFMPQGNADVQFVLHPFLTDEQKTETDLTPSAHELIVSKALEAFQHTSLEKVVVSRTKKVIAEKTLAEWVIVYKKLCANYPHATVFMFNTGSELWLGATPELLVAKAGDQCLTTALAGTQPFTEGASLSEVHWGEKEKREQQLVTDFILDKLKEANADVFDTNGPHTVPAGQVVHLKTNIIFKSDLPASEMAAMLHPTPAVCGMPRTEALQFIAMHEPHHRSFYTGYMGVEHAAGDDEYWVILRCLRVRGSEVTLFAGGGIVPGSVAAAEWHETENKMQVMQRFL
ncbi:MAG: chorismate-binding protein [Flavobacteriales bacterium]